MIGKTKWNILITIYLTICSLYTCKSYCSAFWLNAGWRESWFAQGNEEEYLYLVCPSVWKWIGRQDDIFVFQHEFWHLHFSQSVWSSLSILLDVKNAITSFPGNKDIRTKVQNYHIPYISLKVRSIQVRNFFFSTTIRKIPCIYNDTGINCCRFNGMHWQTWTCLL